MSHTCYVLDQVLKYNIIQVGVKIITFEILLNRHFFLNLSLSI